MKPLTGVALFLALHAAALLSTANTQSLTSPAGSPSSSGTAPLPSISNWSSPKVEHAYGLPEIKSNKKGTLAIDGSGLSFTAKGGSSYSIPRASLLALNAGNERVELWGMKGRLLRMAIPQGGGLAAAGILHHKVNMLSVEFVDPRQGYHAAVFYLPAGEAQRVLSSFAELPPAPHGLTSQNLQNTTALCHTIVPRSVLLAMPEWNGSNVPSAYRDLVYEHAIERLKKVKDIGRVYRDGEVFDGGSCPQYTIHMTVTAFKQGNQVQRAMTGPIGFFFGTTQMMFTMNVMDSTRRLSTTDQMKATVRGEGESRNVADNVAKSLVKRYASETKKFEKEQAASARTS